MGLVYLNGKYLPQDEACVPVLDRGFIFGDGVYEVLVAYGGRLFRFQHHMQRLDNSLRAVHIENPMTEAEWFEVLNPLLQQHPGHDQSIYLQVTRGVAKRDHLIPEKVVPTIFAMSNPMPEPDPRYLSQGMAAVVLPDTRWQNCHIKAISLLPNILLRHEAEQQGGNEAILVRNGWVTEGSATNVFVVSAGRLLTPPKGPTLLPGITRDLLLELARDNGIDCAEANISEQQLLSAEEVMVSSTLKELYAVTTVNGKPLGNGQPGPVWRRLYDLFQNYKVSLRRPI